MAKYPKVGMISTLFVAVVLSAAGFWWFYSPLSQVERPQPIDSDDFLVSTAERDSWNKEVLSRFEEIPMRSGLFPDPKSYRMVLMPTFASPISIRASRTANGFELTTKILDGQGGYEIGRLWNSEKRPMTEAEWKQLMELLIGTSFWTMPTTDPRDGPVVDGATWLIESRRDSIFHNVERITPKPKFLELCKYFLQLAGKEIDYIGYWSID